MTQTEYYVIFNGRSGTAQAAGLDSATLRQRFAAAGASATIDADWDRPLEERLARARDSTSSVVVAAGGDGTVTAVAEALVGTDKALAILPLGTLNALARDLGIPFDVDAWFAALPDLQPRSIDVGCVNGRVFLHKVVIGVVPSLAAGREQIRGKVGIGSLLGYARFVARRLVRSRRMAVEIQAQDGAPHIERIHALAVASNAYAEGAMRVFSRQRLDAGFLTVYAVRHLRVRDFLRLTTGMLVGHWLHDPELKIEQVRAVTIRTHRQRLKVMFDGEILSLETPLSFSIAPRALPVMVLPGAVTPLDDDDYDDLETVA